MDETEITVTIELFASEWSDVMPNICHIGQSLDTEIVRLLAESDRCSLVPLYREEK